MPGGVAGERPMKAAPYADWQMTCGDLFLNPWRGDLAKRRTAPLGCEAALKPANPVCQNGHLIQ